MNILHWPIKNPVFVNIILVLLIIVGLMTIKSLPSELNPEISLNWVQVTTIYNGASPEEMEKLVSKKLEDAISEVDKIESITSWSGEGYSRVSVKFEDISDEDFQRLYQELTSEVGNVTLPTGAEKPTFFKWSSSTFLPVLNIAVFGNVAEKELKQVSKELKDALSDLSSISKINTAGERDREMWVEVLPERLNALKISFDEVQMAIAMRNINISAGAIKNDKNETVLRVIGEYKTEEDILNTIIKIENNKAIKVGDIATVTQTFKRAASISRFNGYPAITISTYKKPGYGTLETVEDIKKIIEDKRAILPPSINIDYATDTSYLITDGLNVLAQNAWLGLILVLVILQLFLGTRNAIFTALGIPTALLITFIFLKLFDQTLNLSVMFGLVLVLGMLVDDAIVVLENIYRYIEEGLSPVAAVLKGVPEVAAPVISSVLTTIAAFLPLMLMPGIMGKFMRVIPLVVCLALVASIFEAFFIMPQHIAKFGKKSSKLPPADNFLNKLRDFNDKILTQTIAGRFFLIIGVIIAFFIGIGLLMFGEIKFTIFEFQFFIESKIFIISIMMTLFIFALVFSYYKDNFKKRFIIPLLIFTLLGSLLVLEKRVLVNFFAGEPFNQIFVRVKAPQGTTLAETERIIKDYEQAVLKLPEFERKSIISNVGLLNLDIETINGSNVGEIIVDIVPKKQRIVPDDKTMRSMDEILAELKTYTKDITGVEWIAILYPSDGPPSGKPVEAKILGKDFAVLKEIATLLSDSLKNMRGAINVDNDFVEGKEELRFYQDEYLVKKAGLDNTTLSNTVQKTLSGQPVAIMRDEDEELLIQLKYPENYINSKDKAHNIRIQNRTGQLIPLSNLGEFKEEKSLSTIKRYKRYRAITVSADLDKNIKDASGVIINNRLQEIFKKVENKYPGYRISFEGEFKEFENSMNSLLTLFLIGVGLIYLILGTQFNSWLQPFLIMVTIPLAFVGAMTGLVASGNPFSIGSMYGMVALAGIVVNSAIVLVDFINIERKTGMNIEQALRESVHVRFRPIMLTSMTTVFGMLPTAIGIGGKDANWQPLAITIVFGLFVATILTMYVIPAFYIVLEEFKAFYKRTKWFKYAYKGFFYLLAILTLVDSIMNNSLISGLIGSIIFALIGSLIDLDFHDATEFSEEEKKLLE